MIIRDLESWACKGCFAVLGAVGLVVPIALFAQAGKITFLKDGQVYAAALGGSDVRQLTRGPSEKRMPRWSPDGNAIVYLDLIISRRSRGDLVVIDPLGAQMGRYPISTIDSDGTQIASMRDAEEVGWFDNGHIFASGSVNPYIGEYRKIDTKTSKISGFGGTQFATCSGVGAVAFWRPVFPSDKAMSLETSLTGRVIFQFPDENALPSMNVPIAWDQGCRVVAFIDPRLPLHLVVVTQDGRRSSAMLANQEEVPTVRAIREGFVIGQDWRLLYDLKAARLKPTPSEILEVVKADEAARRHTGFALGAIDPDWWRPVSQLMNR